MKTLDMEYYIARHFDWRKNLIVPNVSWGAGLHECDMLILSKSGCATEIEIKTSRADLKRDAGKEHQHGMKVSEPGDPPWRPSGVDKIKYLYFALPEKICNCQVIHMIPEQAGIITVAEYGFIDIVRKPIDKSKYKFDDKEMYNIARLGTMRIWKLKYLVMEKLREITEIKNFQITLDK